MFRVKIFLDLIPQGDLCPTILEKTEKRVTSDLHCSREMQFIAENGSPHQKMGIEIEECEVCSCHFTHKGQFRCYLKLHLIHFLQKMKI